MARRDVPFGVASSRYPEAIVREAFSRTAVCAWMHRLRCLRAGLPCGSHLPDPLRRHLKDNEDFFTQTLPGRSEPLHSPGGAKRIGRLGVDTPLTASYPQQVAT